MVRRSGCFRVTEPTLPLTGRKYVTVAMASAGEAAALVTVAVLWGGTGPFLRTGAAGLEQVRGQGRLRQLLTEICFLGLNYKYMVPFLLNQCGSLLFYLTLASTGAVAGMLITVLGVTLCVAGSYTRHSEKQQEENLFQGNPRV
ncbi:transmembrane protein 234 isoform X3 [Dromaius novaehollandiae]|uniref:transmembrane protein 234 isoform X3 n=1 Tax=Dromaius novaehollandiae TaxID=8790 RepID=UPI00311DCD2F